MGRFGNNVIFILLAYLSNSCCFNLLPLDLKQTCPEFKPVESFNVSAYGTGVWYEIARYPNIFEVLTKCVSIEYTTTDDVVHLALLNFPKGSVNFVEATARYASNSSHDGSLEFELRYGLPPVSLKIPIKALAVDYDRYAIWYSCVADKITGIPLETAWIMSRTKTLDKHSKEQIDLFFKQSSVPDIKKFIWIDQSDAICEVGSFLGSLIYNAPK